MRPYQLIRTAKDYCCRWCDGPYNKWKRKVKRTLRKRDRSRLKQKLKKDIEK